MKILGFQAKWSILWPHSWHSLFKWSHIVHNGASWNFKQCCLREFSFSLHGKFIFDFPSAQNEFFFVKDLPNICSNDIILWKSLHLGIVNSIDKGIFYILCTKNHFPFFECPKWGFFEKNLPNNCCKIGPHHFYKKLGHI